MRKPMRKVYIDAIGELLDRIERTNWDARRELGRFDLSEVFHDMYRLEAIIRVAKSLFMEGQDALSDEEIEQWLETAPGEKRRNE